MEGQCLQRAENNGEQCGERVTNDGSEQQAMPDVELSSPVNVAKQLSWNWG
jgi:hypothetical protein